MKQGTIAALLGLATACGGDSSGGDGGSSGTDPSGPGDSTLLTGFVEDDDQPGDSDAACSVFQQDCAPTQKCIPYSGDGDTTWNDVRCSPIDAAPKQLGETCSAPSGPVGGEDDCDRGLMCWNVAPGQTQGVCAALCEGSANAGICPSDTVCSVYNDGVLPICLPTCDPLGTGCGPGQVCIPQGNAGGRFVCAVDAAPNDGAYGDACLAFNKCDPGLFCAPAAAVPGCTEAAGCCSRYCDLADDDPDATCDGTELGQSCVPFTGALPAPGTESIGGCAAP